ncbi:MAG: ComF family protein [Defluviitaleaceae bacterium]|nr:ComF family protein [Defluviitaleaceae bacterium]
MMKMMNNNFLLTKSIGQTALEKVYAAIFPNKCLFCQRVLEDIAEIVCVKCCGLLGNSPTHMPNTYIACDYANEAVRNVIHRFKYGGKRMLTRPMAEAIFQHFGKIDADCMVCVPLHEKRAKERGYNQAALLATELSRLMGIAACDGMLRTRETAKQFDLNPEERAANVSGAFALKDGFCAAGKRVLLVDDVFTTGATSDECAKVLMEAGAESVEIVVFAMSAPG